MVEFDLFRRDLATSLLDCADRRRASFASHRASGEDLKVVALLEHLAADAKNVDLHVFLLFQLMWTHKRLARRFLDWHAALLEEIGVRYRPSNATDLVRWLVWQISSEPPPDVASPRPSEPSLLIGSAPALFAEAGERFVGGAPTAGLMKACGRDFVATFGLVAPLLGVWEACLAIGQTGDHAFMKAHAAVPGTVVSVDTTGGGKSSHSAADVVVAFQPSSSSGTCRVMTRSDDPHLTAAPGGSLLVVPRSSDCELPLIPSAIGDPTTTFVVAAALMIGGLASLRLWHRSSTPTRRPPGASTRPRPRHDMVLGSSAT